MNNVHEINSMTRNWNRKKKRNVQSEIKYKKNKKIPERMQVTK